MVRFFQIFEMPLRLLSSRPSITALRFWFAVHVLLLVLGSASCLAQKAPGVRLDGTAYSQARVYLYDDTRVEAKDLVINGDQINFVQKSTQQRRAYRLHDIHVIRVVDGTRFRDYALFGAGVGAASSILTSLTYEPPSGEEINYGPLILGFTAATALIGGIVGTLTPRWKTLYVGNGQPQPSGLGIKSGPTFAPGQVGMQFRLSF